MNTQNLKTGLDFRLTTNGPVWTIDSIKHNHANIRCVRDGRQNILSLDDLQTILNKPCNQKVTQ